MSATAIIKTIAGSAVLHSTVDRIHYKLELHTLLSQYVPLGMYLPGSMVIRLPTHFKGTLQRGSNLLDRVPQQTLSLRSNHALVEENLQPMSQKTENKFQNHEYMTKNSTLQRHIQVGGTPTINQGNIRDASLQ